LDQKEKGIFDGFLEAKPIFKNKEVLRISYSPKTLPHRKDEITHLASILVSALRNETPSNVFIYGKTGTGKTAVANYIGKELEEKSKDIATRYQNVFQEITYDCVDMSDYLRESISHFGFEDFFGDGFKEQIDQPVTYIYINCQHVDTQYRVLTHIANHFIKKWNDRLPLTGLPTDEVYNRLRQNIDEIGGVITIVLDEIDKLVTKSGDDILYNLSRINNDLVNAKASVIGISNDLKFTEFLDARVKSSLGEEELVFPPYDAEQLKDILNQRAKVAFFDGVLDESVIPLCAACAAQEHGDARRALDLLRISAELAERESESSVNENHVRKAQNKIEVDTVREVVRTLPPQSKLVLLGIIVNDEVGKKKLTTGEVYDTYQDLCKKLDMTQLTQRRVTDLISELDMLGIINARVVSFGRGGRTRIIQMSTSVRNIKDIFEESDFFLPIRNYRPASQSTLI